MVDTRIEKLARVLVDYALEVRAGEQVTIEASTLAAPLVRELYRCVLRAGGHPLTRLALDGLAVERLSDGTDAQIDWIDPFQSMEMEKSDASIAVLADYNTRSRSGIEPARQARANRARAPLLDRMLEREAAGEFRWCVTAFPTAAAAQEARMSLDEYAGFVFGACLLEADDPVAAWREVGQRIARLAEWLGAREELRIVAPDTDLRLAIGGRTWVASDGRANFPDGECFTGPLEDSVSGEIAFTYPAIFQGRVVEGVQLRFAGGEVVDARASRGEAFLQEMLQLDEGARRVGEFAFGLNDAVTAFTGEILFDEKIGGTVHLALGESYPQTGGVNKSALHWDMVCDLRHGGEVYADGDLVYRDGRFLHGLFGAETE